MRPIVRELTRTMFRTRTRAWQSLIYTNKGVVSVCVCVCTTSHFLHEISTFLVWGKGGRVLVKLLLFQIMFINVSFQNGCYNMKRYINFSYCIALKIASIQIVPVCMYMIYCIIYLHHSYITNIFVFLLTKWVIFSSKWS